MSELRLTVRQVWYTNTAFWRNPASAGFTFAFPLMFLVIFTTLLGNGRAAIPGTTMTVPQSTFYVASMAAFSVITACYTNIAMSVTFQRDAGILKRIRGTPLPSRTYLAGRVLHATLVGIVLVALTAAFGHIAYGATIPAGATLARFVVTLLVGAGSFAAIALAVTSIVPNADAAPAIVNFSIMPLLFLSDVFIPLGRHPAAWVDLLGKVFPVRHFVQAMQAAFLGTPFAWSDVAVVAAWGLGGLVLASRLFSWEPRR
ncbi:MAG: ABC transporter permease [Actinobacteria bacterium]|nr:ABC transporter permease [Actinomycetota bacterium]